MSVPQDFADRVEGYVDLNMLEQASDECLSMFKAHPDDAELLVYCAGKVSLGNPEQIAQMLTLIDDYLASQPDNFKVRELRAVLLSLENRYAEALDEFSNVPKEERRHDAYWMWFKTLIQSGSWEEARRWIKTDWPSYSLKVKKEDVSVYLKFLWDVSACLIEDEEYQKAAAGYRFLLKHDPGAIGGYLDFGKLLVRMGRRKEAVDILRRGLCLTWKEIDGQNAYPGAMGYFAHERRQISQEIGEELKKLHGL